MNSPIKYNVEWVKTQLPEFIFFYGHHSSNNMVKKAASTGSKQQSQTEATHSVTWEAGKFCLDIAKLVFAGVILAGLMKQDLNYTTLCLIGTAVIVFFAGVGFYLLNLKNRRI